MLKTTQRALSREDSSYELDIGGNADSTFQFLATMTLAEFIIFFTEDCTVLAIWWQTGTYSSDSAVAFANLVVTMTSAWLCVAAYVGSIAYQLYDDHRVANGVKVRYFFLPCAGDRGDMKMGYAMSMYDARYYRHVLYVLLPLLISLGIGFWTYVGVYLIGEGR